MKTKHLFLFTSLFFFSLNINAQWSFGIKGSINQTWMGTGFNYFSTNSQAKANGLGTSLQLYYNTNKHLSFGVEPGYAQRGAIRPYSYMVWCGMGLDDFQYNDASIYTDYVQIPLFVKYRIGAFNQKMELAGKIGYGVSYATSGYQQAELITRDPEGTDIKPIEFGGDSGFRTWDMGTFAGLSLGWHFPFGTVVAEYELYRGSISIHEYFSSLKNQGIAYSLGYRIDF